VRILKIFPGGAFNNLVAAIKYCINEQIHVVNCSLGGDVSSQFVAQAIARARQAGVAIFVAAGNTGDQVKFPAHLQEVACVSAIGQAGNVPLDTFHARTVPEGATLVDWEIHPGRFSCFGPQVRFCGPGVGIISSVPGGYAAWDGTSMADPHVAGVAAFLAAHHPAIAGATVRDAAWVDQLFDLVRSISVEVGLTPEKGGFGLPILPKTLIPPTSRKTRSSEQVAPQLESKRRQVSPEVIAQIVAQIIHNLPDDVEIVSEKS
jgi:subtilisin family serine protease